MAKLGFDFRVLYVVLALSSIFVIACSSDGEATPPIPTATSVPDAATATPELAAATATPEPDARAATPIFTGGPPTWPQIYSGNATVAGQPVPAGFTVIARVGSYESQPIITLDGRYLALTVAPFDEELWGGAITFHLLAPGGAEVQADETETFQPRNVPSVDNAFPLKFPRLP
jgi:hypothetical protein